MKTYQGLGMLAAAGLLLAGCDTTPQRGPLATMPTGTTESTLRQQQLQAIQSDPNRAMQNPVATGANPGTTGIERAATGGTGNAAAGAPVAVNPGTTGIQRAPGVGAPTR